MAKYIRTNEDKIIVFSGLNNHSDFKNFNPISAGFIDFFIDIDGNLNCKCYGRSISLDLDSDPVIDTMYAKALILGR